MGESEENDWQRILQFISVCLPEDNSKNRTLPLDKEIATKLELDLYLVRYYLPKMEQEDYIELMRETDARGDEGYIVVGIKPTGKVAIQNPSKLRKSQIIDIQEGETTNTYTFNGPVGNVAGINQSIMIAYVGEDRDDIVKLLESLKQIAKSFPVDQNELVEGHIEDLNNDFRQHANPTPSTIKRRIVGLLGVAVAIAGGVATATDFANNVLELSNKLEVPTEAIQPQLEKFKSLQPEFEWQSQ